MPWADVLYGCDAIWWTINGGASDFAGLKISQDPMTCRRWPDVKRVHLQRNNDNLLYHSAGIIGWGGNGGFQALNLAVQFGAAKIILVGFDMNIKRGIHWHGKHPRGMHNPSIGNVESWRRRLDAVAPLLKQLNVLVLNASMESSLQNFRKMPFEEALTYEPD